MSTKYDVKDFTKDVLEESHRVPVVADFWAEWCAPCRILGPVLEELASQANGSWKLAKVNTEEHPNIASQYGIRGIPAVKLFVDGQPVNEFTGALPKYQVEYWLQRALPSRFRKDLQAAEYLIAQGKSDEAQPILERVVREEPGNVEARIRLARLLLFSDHGRAREVLGDIEEPAHAEQIEAIRTVARLASLRNNPSDLPPGDVKDDYLAAINNLLHQNYEQALQAFIEILRKDRYYDDDGSRKACIAIFKLLGEDHHLTQKYRREFSRSLY